MKLRSLLIVSAALMIWAGAARAAHVWEDPSGWWGGLWTYNVPADRYTAQELSFDIFGSYTAAERTFGDLFDTNIEDGKWGGGVGLNYFITRNFGISGDINMPDNRGNLVDTVLGNAVFRFPIGNSGLSPYLFGGGGRTTDQVWEWAWDAGVGLEYRMNPAMGVFIDSRYVWVNKATDSILFRAGLRLVF